MIANFLKYLTTRLALAFFTFLIVSYTSLYILYEHVGGEKYNSFFWLIIAALSFLIPSIVLSYTGKLRFNSFLIKAGEYDLSLNSRKAVKRFERLLRFASSFYFFPNTTEKLLKQIYHEYSKFFLGLHAKSQAAQEVYEEAISRLPDDSNLQNILLDIYAEKEHLSKKELKICFHIFKHSTNKRKATEILSKYYIESSLFDFDSQEIFSKAIELKVSAKEKVVDFLILKLIELQREDNFAAEVYLTAYSEYSNKSEAVIEVIIKLALDRKEKGRTDGLSQKIYKTYEGIPEKTRKKYEEQILKARQEKEAVLSSQKEFIEKVIFSLSHKIFYATQAGKTYLKNSILKLQTFKVFNANLLKKRHFVFFSSLSFITVLIITLLSSQGRKHVKPSFNLLNINPQYTTYESKLLYSIQVAAFKTLAGAEKVINDLSEKGETAYYTKTGEKSAWYRVRVGEFKTQKDAKIYAEKLLKTKLIKGYFITNFEQGFIKINDR